MDVKKQGSHKDRLTFFLAGIIQGSISDKKIHPQDYRHSIKQTIKKHFPNSHIVCPIEQHPDSINYSYEKGNRIFLELVETAARADVLVAYLPEASMGTGIEMWEAKRSGKIIIAVSPLTENWVVKFLADAVCSSVDELEKFLGGTKFAKLLNKIS